MATELDVLRLLHDFFEALESSPSCSSPPAQLQHQVFGHVHLATEVDGGGCSLR